MGYTVTAVTVDELVAKVEERVWELYQAGARPRLGLVRQTHMVIIKIPEKWLVKMMKNPFDKV